MHEEGNPPDLEVMFDLAKHLEDKNRLEESTEILLDMVAIDRNW